MKNEEKLSPLELGQLEESGIRFVEGGFVLRDHVLSRSQSAIRAADGVRAAIQDPREIGLRREQCRASFLASIGGLPDSTGDVESESRGWTKNGCIEIERILYFSRPNAPVTANFYRAGGTGKRPGILFLCGHSSNGKAYGEYQQACLILAHRGLAVLSIDPPGQGERSGYAGPLTSTPAIAPGSREHEYTGVRALLAGMNIARFFLHDAMRGLEYLAGRPEVDASRLGATGSSGGGLQTCMLMMCSERLAAAAPACFLSSRERILETGQAQDSEQVWFGMTGKGFDHEDFLLCFAPRPVCILAARHDFFPLQGTLETVERARRYWPDRNGLKLHVEDCCHAYSAGMAKAAAGFFAGQFLLPDPPRAAPKVHPLPDSELTCCREGSVLIEMPQAQTLVTDLPVAAAEARKALPGRGGNRRAEFVAWLRAEMVRDREKTACHPLRIAAGYSEGMFFQRWRWWSQPGLPAYGILFRSPHLIGEKLPVTTALWKDGTRSLRMHRQWILSETAKGRAVWVVDLSGMGSLAPCPGSAPSINGYKGALHLLADNLFWLGDSLAAMRIYELSRLPEAAAGMDNMDIQNMRYYAHGRSGFYMKIAAEICGAWAGGLWDEPIRAMEDFLNVKYYDDTDFKSLVLPGFLRYGDLSDLRKGSTDSSQASN